MKKKEWIIILLIAAFSLIALAVIRMMPKNNTYDPSVLPDKDPEGIWVAVVNRNKVILYFDSGVDAEYEVDGNIGHMTIEVADSRWHVKDVECYDYTCKNMGWVDESSILPIICLPNDIVIIDAETAANMISEVTDVN